MTSIASCHKLTKIAFQVLFKHAHTKFELVDFYINNVSTPIIMCKGAIFEKKHLNHVILLKCKSSWNYFLVIKKHTY
ncbi:hypothetical protein V1477_008419, partial [Vespula maculifrons]